jgi:acyl-CoA thioester hydrolase
MNMANYVVMFDLATDALWAALDIGPDYKRTRGCGTFAVESHILYEQELRLGARASVTSRVLGADAKRLHVAHEMIRLADGQRAAAQEILFLNVDLAQRRVAPWPEDVFARLGAAVAAHAALPPWPWTGRRVSLPAPRGAAAAAGS